MVKQKFKTGDTVMYDTSKKCVIDSCIPFIKEATVISYYLNNIKEPVIEIKNIIGKNFRSDEVHHFLAKLFKLTEPNYEIW